MTRAGLHAGFVIAMIARLTADQVNYLNIGLMIASAALAFRWPFERFSSPTCSSALSTT